MKSVWGFLLFIVLVQCSLEPFTADFEMITKPSPLDEYLGDDEKLSTYKKENGFYKGTMTYYIDGETSYRKMAYTVPSGVVEIFSRGTPETKGEKETIFARMTTCDSSKCSYKQIYCPSNSGIPCEAEQIYDGFKDTTGTSYIEKVKLGTDEGYFVTRDNVIILRNIKKQGVTKPENYFSSDCVKKTCNVAIDLVFAVDVSGSMSSDDKKNARGLVRTVSETFKFGEKDSETRVGIIAWGTNAWIVSSAGGRQTSIRITDIKEKGLISNTETFDSTVKNIEGEGGTCMSCAYKATIETSYAQFIYEATNNKENVLKRGRIGLIVTDGKPTYVLRKENRKGVITTSYEFGVDGTSSSVTWSQIGGDGNTSENDRTIQDIEGLNDNAMNYYKKHTWGTRYDSARTVNDYDNFFKQLTILVLAVKEATSPSMDELFAKIGRPGPVTNPNFSVTYKISDLASKEQKDAFYDLLATNICTGFIGITTNCESDDRPCCGDKNVCG